MWILYACLSSFFAGITAILAKCGIKETDSDVATAIRTCIVLIFSWIMAMMTSSIDELLHISGYTLFFLVLSGIATGASWLCYFHALQLGDVNKVVPIDKSSTVLTILLAVLLFHEPMTLIKGIAIIAIAIGTYLMISKKETNSTTPASKSRYNTWLIYAVLSAVFASATSILGKIGITDIDSNLGTAIRTTVVLFMAWGMVYVKGKQKYIKHINKKELNFIVLSGIATGASWLFYYHALQLGVTSAVVSIDKLSIIITMIFSWLVFKEQFPKKVLFGILLIVLGTLLLLF